VEALAASSCLTGLTRLHLGGDEGHSGAGIGENGARALAGSTNLSGLVFLSLSWNHIGDAGAQALATSPHLSRLRELDLRSNGVGEVGVQALIDSPHLLGLKALGLGGNPAGPVEEYSGWDPRENQSRTNTFDREAAERLRARFRQGPYIYGFDGPVGWHRS
jgi:hypothetical protein